MVDVAVVGAAGYAGIEAVRIVLGHPDLRLTCVTSGQDAGRNVADVYPALTGLTDLAFSEPDARAVADAAQIALLAVPHTAALELVPDLMERGLRIVDLSADFRLRDAGTYERWYGVSHTAPELLGQAVYGLPEISRQGIAEARLVAAPGCYPTASLLAVIPALDAGLASPERIVIDAKSGVSGAGRAAGPGTHFCTVDESLAPYKVAAHRHTPEIEQGIATFAQGEPHVTFVPHLAPMDRGLLATAYLDGPDGLSPAALHAAYVSYFADEPFVHVHERGRMPSTAEVRGTNRAHLGVTADRRTGRIVAVCAIDNLVKGAAGQAVQCANLMLGLPETAGLTAPQPVV